MSEQMPEGATVLEVAILAILIGRKDRPIHIPALRDGLKSRGHNFSTEQIERTLSDLREKKKVYRSGTFVTLSATVETGDPNPDADQRLEDAILGTLASRKDRRIDADTLRAGLLSQGLGRSLENIDRTISRLIGNRRIYAQGRTVNLAENVDVAEPVIEQVQQPEAEEEKQLQEAVETGLARFWGGVADEYPDLDAPLNSESEARFKAEAERIIREWVKEARSLSNWRVRYMAVDGEIRSTNVRAKDSEEAKSAAFDENKVSGGGGDSILRILDVEPA